MPFLTFSFRNPLQFLDIPQWRRAEQAAVLAAELGWALVADLECRAGGVLVFGQHEPPSLVQAYPFLVLERAHGRHGPEMVVECGRAHAGG